MVWEDLAEEDPHRGINERRIKDEEGEECGDTNSQASLVIGTRELGGHRGVDCDAAYGPCNSNEEHQTTAHAVKEKSANKVSDESDLGNVSEGLLDSEVHLLESRPA